MSSRSTNSAQPVDLAGPCSRGVGIDSDATDRGLLVTAERGNATTMSRYANGRITTIGRYVIPHVFLDAIAW
jgi:hypothetical protein